MASVFIQALNRWIEETVAAGRAHSLKRNAKFQWVFSYTDEKGKKRTKVLPTGCWDTAKRLMKVQ